MEKNIIKIIVCLAGFFLMGVSCSKNDNDFTTPVEEPDKPVTPAYPTFDNPNWAVDNASSYEHTMTFAIVLPDSLANNEHSSDCLAIFSNSNDCRGIADRIEISTGKYIWMGIVYGNSNSEYLNIKYYSSNTKYMYSSASTILFTRDGSLGTIDGPAEIGMKIVTTK